MTEKIIDEVMGLIEVWREKDFAAAESRFDPWSENDPSAPLNLSEKLDEEASSAKEVIRTKLRDVLERKPLTDEQIEQETGAKIGQPIFLVAKGFVQATERAHRIIS